MDKSETLKACPFCANETDDRGYGVLVCETRAGGHHWWEVQCQQCEASGPAKDTEVEAIAAWNTRTPWPDNALADDTVERIVAGKRLKIKPGAPEIALLCRAIFRAGFADDEDEAVVNQKYVEWPEDQAKAIRAAHFVLRSLGGNGSVVRALSTSTTVRSTPPEADLRAVDLLRDIREAVTLAREALDDCDETEAHALLSNVQARIDAALKEANDGHP